MKKSTIIKKINELASNVTYAKEIISQNQAEIAVLMKSFNITWNDLTKPLLFMIDDISWDKDELVKLFEHDMEILRLATEKNLSYNESKMKISIKGFINGVRFFDPKTAHEFLQVFHDEYKVI